MRKTEEDIDIEIPGDDDENVGDEAPKKKKRKKSKEERIAERKIVFWTLIIILIITIGFWMVPVIRGVLKGEPLIIETENKSQPKPSQEKPEIKNYVEITL
jgi:flagellar basal body-associated protein FliL